MINAALKIDEVKIDEDIASSVPFIPLTPVPLQRAKGEAKIAFMQKNGQRKLTQLRQAGALKLMLPGRDIAISDVVFINSAGGVASGDQFNLEARLGDGVSLRMASQTAERIYRSLRGYGSINMAFDMGIGAQFDYLPQETIFYNKAALKRALTVNMGDDASFLTSEMIVLGRHAMGEKVKTGYLEDQWRIKKAGKLIFADALKLENFTVLAKRAALNDANALATLLFIDEKVEIFQKNIKAILQKYDFISGVSCWNGIMLVRCLSQCATSLRMAMMEMLIFIRKSPLPKVWMM